MADQLNKSDGKQQKAPFVRSTWQRLRSTKWFFPTAYLVIALVVLGGLWAAGVGHSIMGGTSSKEQKGAQVSVPASTSTAPKSATSGENVTWPVADPSHMQTIIGFFGGEDSAQQQTALIQYANTFYPHAGIDLARQDKQSFDVLAAAAGKVAKVIYDPLLGNEVVIQTQTGLQMTYASLGATAVSPGQSVSAGQKIGTSGRAPMESSEPVHLHFEVAKDGTPIDPTSLLPPA